MKQPVNSGPSMTSGIGTRETHDKEKTPAGDKRQRSKLKLDIGRYVRRGPR